MTAAAKTAVRSGALDRPWIEVLARVGLYGTIGLLAARAAFGWGGGRATDTRGALQAVHQAPYGRHILLLIGAGLAGYALWRLVGVRRFGLAARGAVFVA